MRIASHMSWISQYIAALVVFVVLDVLWLGTVAADLYDRILGDLLAPSPRVGVAVVFYAIFLAGLVWFVIHPAVEARSWRRALFVGAFFGFITYATWDLTNLSVLRDFPVAIVPIDMAWGTLLSAAVSVSAYGIVQALPDWAR